ncbi:MAG: extracellular solute-binding protein [Lentisphaerae bacterium]|nr:extracellular solute-binding protein [Lentisphaerota bacterium]
MSRTHLCLMAIATLAASLAAAAAPPDGRPPPVCVNSFFNPNTPEYGTTRRLIELMAEDPSIRIVGWGGIQLPGAGGKAPLMMAIAGRTAPDIGESWFHIIRNEIRQGFLYPLNEWIGEDRNGDGQIGDDEAIWDGWKRVPPLWRQVATVDGKVYGIPQAEGYSLGVVFRTDLVRAAGLNPNQPPETWDELVRWCQKLTDPNRNVPGAPVGSGQRGIVLLPHSFMWLPWVQSAGGSPIVQNRKSPRTGLDYAFAPEATAFVTPDGEDLSDVTPEWRAQFASPEALAAAELYHRLHWMRWLPDPATGEPVNLSTQDVSRGWTMVGERRLSFQPAEVVRGVARGYPGQRGGDVFALLARGEVAMLTWFVSDLSSFGATVGINAQLLSWFPFPAGPGPKGRRVVQVQHHYIVSYEATGGKSKEERDRIWKTMTAIGDEAARDHAIRERVIGGLARFVNPRDLERLGYGEYLRDLPESIRRTYREMDEGLIQEFTEPWMGFWVTAGAALDAHVTGLLASGTSESLDYAAGLREVERQANSGLMFDTPRATLDRHRPVARVVFSAVVGFMAFLVFRMVRAQLKRSRSAASARSVFNPWFAWGLVMPAILLIGLWSYYPLARGMVMAFQDYHITGHSPFVGLDNFINLALDASFWRSLGRTAYFVFLNMCLAFCAPIVLAILLTEVPRGKIFYRTLFFLPQMTSGLVIALLWKLMYEPTPQGFFNQILALVNRLPFVEIGPQTWLQDPKLAMICCVLPTVWASMGMASLIYLAALHSVPPDFYEAADIDGAGIVAKLTRITLPSILPLIIINFVGTFIGTFQNMGSIFLLTFGGPGEATTVAGLRIWIEAYNNLRFSMATSMAWVLGSLLIGLTYFQIQFLSKVEYRRAQE